MKKLFLLLSIPFFLGCSNDDDSTPIDKSSFIGEYNFSSKFTNEGNPCKIENCEQESTLILQSNDRGYHNNVCDNTNHYIKWEYNENKIYITYEDGSQITCDTKYEEGKSDLEYVQHITLTYYKKVNAFDSFVFSYNKVDRFQKQ